VKQAKKLPLYDVGLSLFRSALIQDAEIRIGQHLVSTILSHITLERQSYPVDRTAIKANLEMLQQLYTETKDTVYVQDFEPLFMGESRKFYERESTELLTGSDASTYLRYVERRLQEEYERSQHYLSPSSEPKIRHIVEKELIATHMKTVADVRCSRSNLIIDGKWIELYVEQR
jgi:cullin 3